jgi:hypothetical protein
VSPDASISSGFSTGAPDVSVIKPRIRGKAFVQIRTRLDQQNYHTLLAYVAFLDEDINYVLNEVIDCVLARDKDFIQWRATHPQPAALPVTSARGRPRSATTHTARVFDLGVAGSE